MSKTTSSSTVRALFVTLKGLAAVAELAMLAGVLYAAVTAARYWPTIGV